jgi:choline dehydrogenase-like flavoprotein
MGTAQMGSDPGNSVVNSWGEFHNVKGLFVADASVFPTSIGVNPQVTIMALATRTAAFIAENFSDYQAQ